MLQSMITFRPILAARCAISRSPSLMQGLSSTEPCAAASRRASRFSSNWNADGRWPYAIWANANVSRPLATASRLASLGQPDAFGAGAFRRPLHGLRHNGYSPPCLLGRRIEKPSSPTCWRRTGTVSKYPSWRRRDIPRRRSHMGICLILRMPKASAFKN